MTKPLLIVNSICLFLCYKNEWYDLVPLLFVSIIFLLLVRNRKTKFF